MKKRPNLIFFIPDQWRGDVLGHAGNPAAHTPNLDQLVEKDAISFLRAFCQNPVCVPSRCSFLTGWYPHVRGHRTMSYLLQPDEPCLLRDLKEAGYHIWWGGKNDAVAGAEGVRSCCNERDRGNEHHLNLHVDQRWRKRNSNGTLDYSFYAGRLEKDLKEEVYLDSDWSLVRAAQNFIKNYKNDQPFCIYLSLQYPHPPYGVEEPYFSEVDCKKLPARRAEGSGKPRLEHLIRERQALGDWTEEKWAELRATYYGQCARVDDQFGQIINALKQAGYYENTAVFFFSDHGDYTGDYGIVEKAQNLFEDCLTRVPLIIKPPADTKTVPGCRSALVELIDIAATVYWLAELYPEHDHFGKSLHYLFSGDGLHRDAVFCEGGIRPGDWLEPVYNDQENLYWPRVSWSKEDPQAYGRAIMCRTEKHKYVMRLEESDELYDLENDPNELCNLINDSDRQKNLIELRSKVLKFLWETADAASRTPDARDAF